MSTIPSLGSRGATLKSKTKVEYFDQNPKVADLTRNLTEQNKLEGFSADRKPA